MRTFDVGSVVAVMDDDGEVGDARVTKGVGRGKDRRWTVVSDSGWVVERTTDQIEAAIQYQKAFRMVQSQEGAVLHEADLLADLLDDDDSAKATDMVRREALRLRERRKAFAQAEVALDRAMEKK